MPPKRKARELMGKSSNLSAQHKVAITAYDDMLREASVTATSLDDDVRILKKRKSRRAWHVSSERHESDEARMSSSPCRTRPLQTVYDTSETSDDSEEDWEQVDLRKKSPGEQDQVQDTDDRPKEAHSTVKDLTIVIDPNKSQPKLPRTSRRLPATILEKKKRLDIHKIHLCCLLAHVYIRNAWCNDEDVQDVLRPLLNKKMTSFFNPNPSLPQFARARSFADGLQQASDIWRVTFQITARGLRRPTWIFEPEVAKKNRSCDELDEVLSKKDFLTMSSKREGSRDVGAQLFCALLRSAGLRARLVCSLQPLPFATLSPAPKLRRNKPTIEHINTDSNKNLTVNDDGTELETSELSSVNEDTLPSNTLRRVKRFGVRQANHIDLGKAPPVAIKQKRIKESPYPVYWVEAFNVAIQKWMSVDPLVSNTVGKNSKFEPPASDSSNDMTYVVAFDENGVAKDVTRRYVKSYNGKTRRNRVEFTAGGELWWKRALSIFDQTDKRDEDQVEEAELAHREASEPMPRNVQDFKNHPYYALERHLRSNEVIHPKREVGKLNTGKGADNIESIYRRRDVQLVKTAGKWYREGRTINPGEQPLKHAAKSRRKDRSGTPDTAASDVDAEDDQGRALYAQFQTSLYIPPPVIQGRVPRNAFGNLDVYMPSMIPPGSVHIRATDAAKAARIVGIDFADAVTGFEFRGRHGSAITQGIVVAKEYRDAVEQVVEGLMYQREITEDRKRSSLASGMWKRFLIGLRIRERVIGCEVEGEASDLRKCIDDAEAREEEEVREGGFVVDNDRSVSVDHPPEELYNTGILEDSDDASFQAATNKHLGNATRRPKYRFVESTVVSPWDPPGLLSKFKPISSRVDRDEIIVSKEADKAETLQLPPKKDFGLGVEEEGGGFCKDSEEFEGGFLREDSKQSPTDYASHQQNTMHEYEEVPNHAPAQNLDHDRSFPGGHSNGSSLQPQEVGRNASARDMIDEPIVTTTSSALGEHDSDREQESDNASMLSQDPEDEEAEPDWLADETII